MARNGPSGMSAIRSAIERKADRRKSTPRGVPGGGSPSERWLTHLAIRCIPRCRTSPVSSQVRILELGPEVLLATTAFSLHCSGMDPSHYRDHFQNTSESRAGPVARLLGNEYVPAASGQGRQDTLLA